MAMVTSRVVVEFLDTATRDVTRRIISTF